jgi:undecaprenyl phosphate N,N'-diacetylbacillosamine 1-phosphate transferase
MKKAKGSTYSNYIKRPIDIIISLTTIIVISPILLMVAILVRAKLGSPVLFKQKRPGINEKIFMMYKFKTMTDQRDEYGKLLPDSDRLTSFGKILRSTSLDELPELYNIIKGDMSIVGPRPQLVKDMVFMTPEQRTRHSVLPGLTGWAQVNGRNAVSWEDKLSLDLDYISEITFKKDLKIIIMTVIKVFKRDDINSSGFDTAEDYGDYLLRIRKISKEDYNIRNEEAKKLLEKLPPQKYLGGV